MIDVDPLQAALVSEGLRDWDNPGNQLRRDLDREAAVIREHLKPLYDAIDASSHLTAADWRFTVSKE